MATVFLSYDHDDAVHAAPVASALEKAGHSVWWDRHIKGGAEYNHEIESAVDKADAVVVLWSERSIRSAWVRDEAAEGRDQCKLVPVKIEAVKPPTGFRQFQTIDLSGSSRATSGNSLRQLLETIDALAGTPGTSSPPMEAVPARRFGRLSRRTSIAMAALVLCAIAALLVWNWRSQPVLPVIAVAPSDSGARSQALSRDLLVKLGTLARVGASKWQLADPQSARSDPDLVFRVADSGSSGQPQASLMLLDGRRDTLVSRIYAGRRA